MVPSQFLGGSFDRSHFVLSCTHVKSFGLEEKNQSVVTTGEAAWLWQGWSVVVMPEVACWLALMLRQGECP